MSNDSNNDYVDDFQDPLENYDPKTIDDPIERALVEETVDQIQSQPFAAVSPDVTVHDAVDQLAKLHVACLLVVDDGKLVGILTDRNVLDHVALEHETVMQKSVHEVMTPDPVFVYDSDQAAATLCVMAVSGYRHVPVVNSDEQAAGIVSPQRVTKFLKQQFDSAGA